MLSRTVLYYSTLINKILSCCFVFPTKKGISSIHSLRHEGVNKTSTQRKMNQSTKTRKATNKQMGRTKSSD